MELKPYFSPIPAHLNGESQFTSTQLGALIRKHMDHFPDLEGIEMALLWIGPGYETVRKALYALHAHFNCQLADLGNFIMGDTENDTGAGLTWVVERLLEHRVVPVLIGASQSFTSAQFAAFHKMDQKVDIVVVDAAIDLVGDHATQPDTEKNTETYLSKIITSDGVFNISFLGYQSYLVSPLVINAIDRFGFDAYRLGEIAGNLRETEPVLRSANLISFDLSAIRAADAPGLKKANPNGFYGEEACQLCRYAGMSDNVQSIGFYEIDDAVAAFPQTAALISQMLWYFIEGHAFVKGEGPLGSERHFLRYRTEVKNEGSEIVFFKSRQSGRWWMQVPYLGGYQKNEKRHVVPCTYEDFKRASHGEIPDRWIRSLQRLA